MSAHLDLEEQEQIDQLKHFWKQWGGLISAIALAVALAFAGYNGWQYWQHRQAAQAAALAETATAAMQTGQSANAAAAIAELQKSHPSTQAASNASLNFAHVAWSRSQGGTLAEPTAQARAALQWVIDHSADAAHRASARLQLAAIMMENKELDAALALVQTGIGDAAYTALAADRTGDILQLQGKTTEAIAAWQKAWDTLERSEPYRLIVGYKLNAHGVSTAQ